MGMAQSCGREESRRRVRPPPGINGTEGAAVAAVAGLGGCSTGEVYTGMGKVSRFLSGVDSSAGEFSGRSW